MLAVLLALSGVSMTVRTLWAAAPREPAALLYDTAPPSFVVYGLLRGSPAQPGWQEAAAPFAARQELRTLALLALSGEGELKPEVRTWLAKLAAGTAPSGAASREAALDRLLAAFALERPSDARPR